MQPRVIMDGSARACDSRVPNHISLRTSSHTVHLESQAVAPACSPPAHSRNLVM